MTNKPKKPNTKDTTAPYTFKRGDFVMFDNMVGLEATGVVVLGPTEDGTPPGMVAVWTGEVERTSSCTGNAVGELRHVLYELAVDKLKLLPTLGWTTYGGQYHA